MTDKRLLLPRSAAQVVIKYLLDAQPVESVFYVQHQHREEVFEAPTAANFDSDAAHYVAGLVKDWLMNDWSPVASVAAGATEVDVIWTEGIPSVGPLKGVVLQDSDFPVEGTLGTEPLPNNVSVAMAFRTSLLGRSYHGRMYHVGLDRGQVSGGAPNVLESGAADALVAAYKALHDKMADYEFVTGGVPDGVNDRFPMQVASFVSGRVTRDVAVLTTINSVTLSDLTLDSMRRRLPGHNRHGSRS